jgi:SNF family Na+-dependent transporter
MRDALARVQAAVARHPRLLMTLLLVGLLVVSADPVVATDGSINGFETIFDLDFEVSTDGDSGVSGSKGPTNP